eukprot:maker-scaffold438_size171652-snap-gene-0.34 protein:Tk03128 transcript:maker-scaffold438_size171652-snap-gene-0.34-mRNA-1 annotation:"solute carrier family 35 member e2"
MSALTATVWSRKAVVFLVLWYFWSGCTLFLNKYVVYFLKGDPVVLACSQMWLTLILGALQLYIPCGMGKAVERASNPANFYLNMLVVGGLRFATVLLGLVALNYVEVSFTETVKSSAPAFTVLISRCLTGEVTGLYVNLSLLPVMAGLALCSANELSFHILGFLAALGTNVSECLQNVFSKVLISGESYQYSPVEMQYYTSLTSLLIQVPALLFMADYEKNYDAFTVQYFACCALNGIFFHFQTISAYVLMDFISPVAHSVANTVKRALLIWLSVILFGNPVTFLSGLGTLIVILGVVAYNKAREIDQSKKWQIPPLSYGVKDARQS